MRYKYRNQNKEGVNLIISTYERAGELKQHGITSKNKLLVRIKIREFLLSCLGNKCIPKEVAGTCFQKPAKPEARCVAEERLIAPTVGPGPKRLW